ncbi:MAG: hypothetical protein OXE86_02765 [Alphaproteobacteria bacterium]|nr:hypothetical protein [Alphaproteobacteria bacterium]
MRLIPVPAPRPMRRQLRIAGAAGTARRTGEAVMARQEHGEVGEGALPRRCADLEPACTGRMGSTFFR